MHGGKFKYVPYYVFSDNRGGSDRRRGGDRHGGARGDGDRGGKPGGRSGGLSDSQRDRLEDMLRKLYPDRNPIAEIMVSSPFFYKFLRLKLFKILKK